MLLAMLAMFLLPAALPVRPAPQDAGVEGPAHSTAAAPSAAGDPAALARLLRELRRAERQAEALTLVHDQPEELLADARVAGERIQLLLDVDRREEARAVDAALGAVRTGPPPLLVARLRLQILDGRAREALAHVDALGAAATQPFEVRAARIRVLGALERWPEAARELAALPPDFPPLFAVRLRVDLALAEGRTLAENDDLLERAIPLLEEALALQPGRADVRTELVIALAQWHRAARAEQLVREVLDEAEGSTRAGLLYALGRVHRTELRDEEAANCFREVLELQPGHGRASIALARCLVRQGRDEEALALVHERLARAPEDPDALFLLAEHALDRREPQRAVDALERVLERHPQSLKALYLSSRALALLGEAERQAEVLRRYSDRTAALAMR